MALPNMGANRGGHSLIVGVGRPIAILQHLHPPFVIGNQPHHKRFADGVPRAKNVWVALIKQVIFKYILTPGA